MDASYGPPKVSRIRGQRAYRRAPSERRSQPLRPRHSCTRARQTCLRKSAWAACLRSAHVQATDRDTVHGQAIVGDLEQPSRRRSCRGEAVEGPRGCVPACCSVRAPFSRTRRSHKSDEDADHADDSSAPLMMCLRRVAVSGAQPRELGTTTHGSTLIPASSILHLASAAPACDSDGPRTRSQRVTTRRCRCQGRAEGHSMARASSRLQRVSNSRSLAQQSAMLTK